MSLLIKGMEMPKVGGKIITIYADGRVLYDGGYIKAVPVPPHGDLIDQGAAVQVAMEWCPDDDGTVGKIGDLRELLDEIEALPIIIESEEGT